MNKLKLEIRLAFIPGLKDIVLSEINQYTDFSVIREEKDSLYLDFIHDFTKIKSLRSVSRAYVIAQDYKYNPLYVLGHKSILGDLIEMIISGNKDKFKTFEIDCAGSDSLEIRNIAKYIQETYKLVKKEDGDVKIHIVKFNRIWEVGIQITPRPLSFRNYKVKNISGSMNPTIAYAMNSLCGLEKASSYLNIFSGSATLLIEAGQCYPNLKKLIGFDNNKKHLSLSVQNIKKAGLIRRIQIKEKDIFNNPDVGKFDVITSDLPFGMRISKNENLENLYRCFIEYCQRTLNKGGILVVYTSKYKIFEKIISESKFKIIKILDLKFVTSANAYLHPKIFACRLR
jgi:tRNA G10  N-methylase Trm11